MDVVTKIKNVKTAAHASGHQDVPAEDVMIERVSIDTEQLPQGI